MGKHKEYNGHRNWNAWNVSLWIGNDEPLYFAACDSIRHTKTIDAATDLFFFNTGLRNRKTPDGGVYNQTATKLALAGLKEGLR